jgi:hypothetical protein
VAALLVTTETNGQEDRLCRPCGDIVNEWTTGAKKTIAWNSTIMRIFVIEEVVVRCNMKTDNEATNYRSSRTGCRMKNQPLGTRLS